MHPMLHMHVKINAKDTNTHRKYACVNSYIYFQHQDIIHEWTSNLQLEMHSECLNLKPKEDSFINTITTDLDKLVN